MEIDQRHKGEIHIPPKPRAALEDRQLLDRPGRLEKLQSESWRVLRITSEFVQGFDELLTRLVRRARPPLTRLSKAGVP